MKNSALTLYLTILAALITRSVSGQGLVVKTLGAKDSLHTFPTNTIATRVVQGGKVVFSSSMNRDEEVRLIVELRTPAMAGPRGKRRPNQAAATQQRVAFMNRLASVASTARITHQFTEVINAVSISVKRTEIDGLTNLAEVRRVHEDKEVRGFAVPASTKTPSSLRESITASATSGKGVRIGLIDTGVDYLHEALGGGFGSGFKVIGGYDFVNNDTDPRDDNGHGTHVAGIIAGSSPTLKGMSPQAKLLSYKVLDASGSGYTSSVIAAIEQAIKDSVDIINISLGSIGGDPNDILSQAVDRAVDAGIVVIVAAGNDGDFGTISSPGAAREALTVGSTDSRNNVSSFSSKGPSNRIYGIKPDVVAPGEAIVSAKMNGGYATMSGTSMAAPYVTGIAANAREQHPDWNAYEIRDAIIAATEDLQFPFFSQGMGKVDTSRVIGAHPFVTPAMLSFGFNNASTTRWTKVDSLLIRNASSIAKTYVLKDLSPRSGIDLRFTPAVEVLASGESKSITVELTTDNSSLPDNSALSEGYGGKILAASSDDTLIIPYVFFKGTVFQISFGEVPLQVIIHDQKKNAYYYTPKSLFLAAIVPEGTYDVITSFSNSAYVFRENVNTRDSLELEIDRGQAKNLITIAPIDETGKALTSVGTNSAYSCLEALVHNGSGISEIVVGGGKIQTASLVQKKYFSDMSKNYSFGYALNVQYGNPKSYTFDVEIDSGIASSQNVQFLPSDLKRVDFKYDIDSTTTRVFPVTWSSFVQQNTVIAVTFYDGSDAPLYYPFTQTGYYTRRASSKFPIFHFREAYKY